MSLAVLDGVQVGLGFNLSLGVDCADLLLWCKVEKRVQWTQIKGHVFPTNTCLCHDNAKRETQRCKSN